MSYPQPDANKYSTSGSGFFRLNTRLLSDGDIYDSQQGAHGLSIGPDSDLSKINVAYFDPQHTSLMNLVSISPARPFPGFIQAANESGLYTPSSRPGRILIWPDENWNVDFLPAGLDQNTMRYDYAIPILDVVEYFSPLGLNPARNDKQYDFQKIPWKTAAGGTWFYLFPWYGRRFASIFFANGTGDTISIEVTGVMYTQNQVTNTVGSSLGVQTILRASSNVLTHANTTKVIKASADGQYDALMITLVRAGAVTALDHVELRINVSDTEV
jgi:hypothetical protein